MMKRVFATVIGAALAATSVPALAVQTVLTFDAATMPGATPACTGTDGGATDRTCNHVDYIGADYGSSATLGVSYDAGGTAISLRAYVGAVSPTSGGAVTFGPGADNTLFSEIIFTPTAGNLVSFRGLDYTNGSATFVDDIVFEIRDAANTLVASQTTSGTPGSYNPNTAYFSGPLTFRFKNSSGGLVIDNVTVDVIGSVTPVPEPAAWALMLGGFGLAGAAMRRRGRPAARLYA